MHLKNILNPGMIALLLWFAAACHHDHEHAHQHDQHAKNHDAGTQALQLSLDNGNKWQMDDHTRNSMNSIRALLESGTPQSLAEYQTAGQTLKSEIDRLIAGCTMSGASHDQLHIFLGQFIPKVQALAEAGSVEKASSLFQETQALTEKYYTFFE